MDSITGRKDLQGFLKKLMANKNRYLAGALLFW